MIVGDDGAPAMKIDILSQGAFESALVHLDSGEQFVSEAGAMYRASANVDIDVTTRSRGSGGFLAGVKRLLAADSFFLSTYQTNDGQPGEVGLAPTHQGEVFVIDVEPAPPVSTENHCLLDIVSVLGLIEFQRFPCRATGWREDQIIFIEVI